MLKLNWFRNFRRIRHTATKQPVASLESRMLLAGVTFSVQGTALRVSGTNGDDEIVVSVDSGNMQINDDGVLINTGVAEGLINTVVVYGFGGNDLLGLDSSLGTKSGQLYGGNDDDALVAGNSGLNILRGQAGVDILVGGSGRDQFIIDQFDSYIVDEGATTNDTLVSTDATAGLNIVLGDANIESITGTEWADSLSFVGEDGNLVISGLGGDDSLLGGGGNDLIYGGTGADLIDGALGNDVIRGEAGADQIDGGGGGDMLDYRTSPAGVTADLTTNLASDGYGTIDTLANIEHLNGSNFDDILTGNQFENTMYGLNGNDIFAGLGAGDRFDGGAGIDTLDYSTAPSGVVVALSLTRQLTGSSHATGDTTIALENVIGSDFGDVLTGSSTANSIVGGLGNDTITGLGGNDTLLGGAGNDIVDGDAGTDQVDGGADNDIIIADSDDDGSGLFDGGTGYNTLRYDTLNVAVNWVLTGGNFSVINGSNAADVVDFSAYTQSVIVNTYGGADAVIGGSGNDTINGGDGDDTIFGGLGGDILRGDAGDDDLFANDAANTDDGIRDRLFGGTHIVGDESWGLVGADPLDTISEVETMH